jgi:hypothetical protein
MGRPMPMPTSGDLPVTLDALMEEVRAIRRQGNRAERHAEQWKAIDVAAQPIMGTGLFILGLAVSGISDAVKADGPAIQIPQILGAGVVLLLGLSCLALPLRLQSYFLAKPARIKSFLKTLDENKDRPVFAVMHEWAVKEGDAAVGVRLAIRQAQLVAKMTFWTFAIATFLLLVASLALIALVALPSHRVISALVLGSAASGLIGVALWFILRGKTKDVMAPPAAAVGPPAK